MAFEQVRFVFNKLYLFLTQKSARLGGYSLGSVIAFEMALQLEQLVQSGEVAMSDVEYLGLVDGSPNWVSSVLNQ